MGIILQKKDTGRKNGRYRYRVIDEASGEIISERSSNRQYVAATRNGAFYFGRVDLIGKGDHGRSLRLNQRPEHLADLSEIAYLQTSTPES